MKPATDTNRDEKLAKQPKHTQGVWKVEKRTKIFDAHITCGDKIIGFASHSPQQDADIEFIVKACNMHNELVRALNDLVYAFSNHEPKDYHERKGSYYGAIKKTYAEKIQKAEDLIDQAQK
jgi:hypothetical protein